MIYSPAKGRRDNPNNRAIDTIHPESAEQAMLEKQDAIIAQINALQSALVTLGTSLAAATTVTNVASAGSALETAVNALAALKTVVLE